MDDRVEFDQTKFGLIMFVLMRLCCVVGYISKQCRPIGGTINLGPASLLPKWAAVEI